MDSTTTLPTTTQEEVRVLDELIHVLQQGLTELDDALDEYHETVSTSLDKTDKKLTELHTQLNDAEHELDQQINQPAA